MEISDIGPVAIAGLVFDLEEDSSLLNDGLYGQCRTEELKIRIRPMIPVTLKAQTIVHEVMHAINDIYLESRHVDEPSIAGLSQGWFQVLVDNPKLVEFMTGVYESEEKVCTCKCEDQAPCQLPFTSITT